MIKTIPFEEFERAVMQKLLEKNTSINKTLREQYQKPQVISREFTGVGFFTDFKVPENVFRVTEPLDRAFGDVICEINGIEDFGGFVLFTENGVIEFLEGYTCYDNWPSVITSYRLYHLDGNIKYY